MSDSEQPIKKPHPPRRNPPDPLRSKWGVALAASLVFHLGIGAVLALNPPRPIAPGEDRRTYTPETYARKAETAQAKVRKMEQVARKMEALHRKARENYEKRTGQKLPPLPSTPATPPPDAAVAAKPESQSQRSAEEARLAQREAQEAQQNVETALRDADAALAKGDLTGYHESVRRAAQAARKVTEAQGKAIKAQKETETPAPGSKPPATKPVIDAAMKQQIAAAQAQRKVQVTIDKAVVAPTLEAAKKAQAEAKTAQEESARNQVQAKQKQEAEAKKVQAQGKNAAIAPQPSSSAGPPDPAMDALNRAGESAMGAMLSQEMALKSLDAARKQAHQAEKDSPAKSAKTPESEGKPGDDPEPAGKQSASNEKRIVPPAKGSELPVASRPDGSHSDKPEGTAAPEKKSGGSESQGGIEKALAEAGKYQQDAAGKQQAAQKALAQGGTVAPGQNQARQQAQMQAMEAQRGAEQARQQAETALASGDPEAMERALNDAVAAQRDAMAAQAKATSNQEGASAGQPARPGGGSAQPGRQTPPNDVGDALAAARNAEARIDSMFREIRALERASTGRVPLKQARQETRTQSVGGGGKTLSDARITGKSPARSVNDAEQKIDAMAARAQRMLDQAQAQQGSTARLFADRMVSLAAQDTGGKTADLSGLMNNQEGKGTRRQLPGDPDYIAPPPPPALPDAAIKAIPGRRVTRGNAPPATWMFVDTWYVIGPFPNPARKNLATKFPPETRVDLDAAYPGMGGRTLKWQFWQFNSPEMVPPDAREYAIYYYYTELYFDAPRDAWVAVGSDDQSTLWLNGQLAWKSSDQLKGWQIGEGLRRVHFKAGRNPILVRLENGWRGAAVSVVVALKQ